MTLRRCLYNSFCSLKVLKWYFFIGDQTFYTESYVPYYRELKFKVEQEDLFVYDYN